MQQALGVIQATAADFAAGFLGDEALRKGWQVPVDAAPTGKRVLVVGAGPSGLSAAYHHARLGHSVTIKDAGAAVGGMMRYGVCPDNAIIKLGNGQYEID